MLGARGVTQVDDTTNYFPSIGKIHCNDWSNRAVDVAENHVLKGWRGLYCVMNGTFCVDLDIYIQPESKGERSILLSLFQVQ